MKIFGSLLIALVVVSSSVAQDGINKLLSRDVVVSEVEARDLGRIDIADLENAGNGDSTSFAALAALKKGNDLWRSGEIAQSNRSYQEAVNLDPALYSAQFNLGLTFLLSSQYDRAAI